MPGFLSEDVPYSSANLDIINLHPTGRLDHHHHHHLHHHRRHHNHDADDHHAPLSVNEKAHLHGGHALSQERHRLFSPPSRGNALTPDDYFGHHQKRLSPRSLRVHDSFEDSSTSSAHPSEASDAAPVSSSPDGDATARPASMNSADGSLASAKDVAGRNDSGHDSNSKNYHNHHNYNSNTFISTRNGTNSTGIGMGAGIGHWAGSRSSGRKASTESENGTHPDRANGAASGPRQPTPSSYSVQAAADPHLANGSPPRIGGVDDEEEEGEEEEEDDDDDGTLSPGRGALLPSSQNNPDRRSQQSPSPLPSAGLSSHHAPPTPSIVSVPGSPDHPRKVPQPNRLSGASVYATPLATPSASASSAGFPTPNPNQRRILEAPRGANAPARSSRDGPDTVTYASGRFSPTAATPPVGVGGSSASGRRSSVNLGRRATRSGQGPMQSGSVDGPRDEVVPDEDARRWADAYRHKMASKRRKREEEDDDRVLVGTKVDEHHANWVTAYNMLTGIRVSVSRTNAKLDRPLTDADFEAKQKSTFDIAGNELVPSAKYDFKFKDYAPWVFRHLRALFQLDPADYLMSLTGKYILSELGSPGKSGSFFYFSRDYKYIIKTIHHAEHKFLRKILRQYYKHVTDNPNTLLSQFYGLHRVKIPYGKKIHFVVMNNLFPPHRDIHQTFDLKGSTVGRSYKEDDLEENSRATLKDLNWMRRSRTLELGLAKKRLFLEQLQRDVRLLKALRIMDYSLLIGIHDLKKGNDENLRGKTLQVFNPGGERSSEDDHPSVLLRTPSKLESARKAKELRQMIRQERPVPLGQTPDRMPDVIDATGNQSDFYRDEGGFRATREDNSPADEVYYLGVIDCLTHYGIIKKIEHFWKGLGSDRTQISALPPDQYGDRFFNFIEGITLSSEEAARARAAKEAEEAVAATAEAERPGSRRFSGSRRRSASNAPPILGSGDCRSPEAQAVADRASQDARQAEHDDFSEEQQLPDRTRGTVQSDHRGSAHEPTILPIVEEAAEASSTGTRNGDDCERPATPAKPVLNRLSPGVGHGGPPPTPPKTGYLKPDSADSGYGGNGNGNDVGAGSGSPPRPRHRLSVESLNKNLPPLPGVGEKRREAGAGAGFFRTGVA